MTKRYNSCGDMISTKIRSIPPILAILYTIIQYSPVFAIDIKILPETLNELLTTAIEKVIQEKSKEIPDYNTDHFDLKNIQLDNVSITSEIKCQKATETCTIGIKIKSGRVNFDLNSPYLGKMQNSHLDFNSGNQNFATLTLKGDPKTPFIDKLTLAEINPNGLQAALDVSTANLGVIEATGINIAQAIANSFSSTILSNFILTPEKIVPAIDQVNTLLSNKLRLIDRFNDHGNLGIKEDDIAGNIITFMQQTNNIGVHHLQGIIPTNCNPRIAFGTSGYTVLNTLTRSVESNLEAFISTVELDDIFKRLYKERKFDNCKSRSRRKQDRHCIGKDRSIEVFLENEPYFHHDPDNNKSSLRLPIEVDTFLSGDHHGVVDIPVKIDLCAFSEHQFCLYFGHPNNKIIWRERNFRLPRIGKLIRRKVIQNLEDVFEKKVYPIPGGIPGATITGLEHTSKGIQVTGKITPQLLLDHLFAEDQ